MGFLYKCVRELSGGAAKEGDDRGKEPVKFAARDGASPEVVEALPEAPTPEADVPVGDPDPVVLRPVPVDSPKPRYPLRASERGVEGVVLLRLVGGVGGDVVLAEVDESSGSALLDRSALGAVRGWRFEPGREDGVAVEMELPWRLVFSLDS